MRDNVAAALPEGVFEHAGLWWRRTSGATSTFAENIAARALFHNVHEDQFWNPWRLDERAVDLERAMAIMEQWERAEPGFQRMTKPQWDAEMARRDHDRDLRFSESEARRQRNRERYDRGRERARLELLEQGYKLVHRRAEVAKLRRGESYPSMDPARRATQVAELDERIAGGEEAVERLTAVVGDVEDVPDVHGYLPRDRRQWTLYTYREFRIRDVRRIRESLPELEAQIKGTDDKADAPPSVPGMQSRRCDWSSCLPYGVWDLRTCAPTAHPRHTATGTCVRKTTGLAQPGPANARPTRRSRRFWRQAGSYVRHREQHRYLCRLSGPSP